MVITTFELGREYYHQRREIERWCEQQFGTNPDSNNWVYSEPGDWETRIWAMSEIFGYTTVYFKNEQDSTLFALRWCGLD
jgi:hypothetical protein